MKNVNKNIIKKKIIEGKSQKQIAEETGSTVTQLKILLKQYNLKTISSRGGSLGKDLTGLKFTSLKVVELASTGHYGKEYLCRCDCGNEKVIRGSLLTNYSVKSCGCHIYLAEHWNVGKLKPSKSTARIGERFNRLEIEGIEHIVKNGKPSGYLMVCRCDCGKLTKQVYADIVKSKVVSCGCWQKEKASITGSTIGCNNAKNNYKWFFYKNNIKTYCRSGYEVLYANYLSECGENFEYESKCFKLKNGNRYTPDFYLSSSDTYIEIKGALRDGSFEKMEMFSKNHKLEVVFWRSLVDRCGLPFNTYSTYFKKAKLRNIHITDYLANKEYQIC